MKCRKCSAEIADKAIVCYRCGTPTVEYPAAGAPARQARRSRWLWMVLVLVAGVLVWVWYAYVCCAAPQ